MKRLIISFLFIFHLGFSQTNYSLSFDGVDDYVDLGTGFNLQYYTIEVRLKTNNTGEGAIIAKSVGANADASSWKIMQANGIVKVGVDGDASVPTITGNNIADNCATIGQSYEVNK